MDASDPNDTPLENINALPLASYIVGFLNEGGASGIIATANSGAIFEDGPRSVPEPGTVMLLGFGLLSLGFVAHRKTAASTTK